MPGFKVQFNFTGAPSGTYTSNAGTDINITLEALIGVMEKLPDPPSILNAEIKPSGLLPKNTIIISRDIADAIEAKIKNPR